MNPAWIPHQNRLNEKKVLKPQYPQTRFKGRGIVTCAGGERYFPGAYVLIRLLRTLGCSLPIEVWYLGSSEMPNKYKQVLSPYNVKTVDAIEVSTLYPMRILKGWELKIYAIMNSAFEEVLFLDADNVPVADPSFLFETDEYRNTGAIFWPDRGRLAPDADIWKLCGVEYRDEPEFETGQMVIKKGRCWAALNITKHLNEWSDFYYEFVHGDKETFHFGWRIVEQEFSMAPSNYDKDWMVLYQHDFNGNRLFQHRGGDKWSLFNINCELPRFAHEALCFTFLEDLSSQLQSGPILGFFDRVFLINLDKDVERMEKSRRRLEAAGIPFERFSAVSDPEGHRGCALSHRQIMQISLDRGYHRVMVLEDDVIIRDDFVQWISLLAPDLNQYQWDLFYFGLHLCNRGEMLTEHIGQVREGYHAHAYAFNVHSIPRLMQCIDEYLAGKHSIFDHFSGFNLRKLYCDPILAIQEPGYSYTLGQVFDRFHQYFPVFDRREFATHCAEMKNHLAIDEIIDLDSIDIIENNYPPPRLTVIVPNVTESTKQHVMDIFFNQAHSNVQIHYDSVTDYERKAHRWNQIIPVGTSIPIEHANEWVTFLDQDHLPDYTFIQSLYDEIERHPESDILVFNHKSRYSRPKRITDLTQVGPAFACKRAVSCDIYSLNGRVISALFFEQAQRKKLRVAHSKNVTYYRWCEPFPPKTEHFNVAASGMFHLGVAMHSLSSKVRWSEYLHCLENNLVNPLIKEVLVVEEDNVVKKEILDSITTSLSDRITFLPLGRRAHFSDVASGLHANFGDKPCIIANADIFFDQSLLRLSTFNLGNIFIALSRWDLINNALVSFPAATSQDAWIFHHPLPKEIGTVPFGIPDCDYRIAFQANAAGYCLMNPMKDVKAIHWHASQMRSYNANILLSGEKIPSVPFSPLVSPMKTENLHPSSFHGTVAANFGMTNLVKPADTFSSLPLFLCEAECVEVVPGERDRCVTTINIVSSMIFALPTDRMQMSSDAQGIVDRFMRKLHWPYVKHANGSYFELWILTGPLECEMEIPFPIYVFNAAV